jgi:hypothetical protein
MKTARSDDSPKRSKKAKTDDTSNTSIPSPDSVASTATKLEIVSSKDYELVLNFPDSIVLEEDDLAVAIRFRFDALNTAVAVMNNAQMPIPPWLVGLVYPFTAQEFESSVVTRCSQVTAGGILDGFCICPNTLSESMAISSVLSVMCLDPFILAMANAALLPLGKVYFFTDGGRSARGQPVNVHVLGLPAGQTQAFV